MRPAQSVERASTDAFSVHDDTTLPVSSADAWTISECDNITHFRAASEKYWSRQAQLAYPQVSLATRSCSYITDNYHWARRALARHHEVVFIIVLLQFGWGRSMFTMMFLKIGSLESQGNLTDRLTEMCSLCWYVLIGTDRCHQIDLFGKTQLEIE